MPRYRHEADDLAIDRAAQLLMTALSNRIEERGRGIFVSSHEILGVLDEEADEFRDEVKSNDSKKQLEELLDIGVGALWGIVSMQSEKMDW